MGKSCSHSCQKSLRRRMSQRLTFYVNSHWRAHFQFVPLAPKHLELALVLKWIFLVLEPDKSMKLFSSSKRNLLIPHTHTCLEGKPTWMFTRSLSCFYSLPPPHSNPPEGNTAVLSESLLLPTADLVQLLRKCMNCSEEMHASPAPHKDGCECGRESKTSSRFHRH